tara:strand:- start:5783 stop:7375 length:1593 start_codon:yes stop_codon:yes gene_type:complete
VILDIRNGKRYRRSQLQDKEGFDRLAAECDVTVAMPLRVPDWVDEEGYGPLDMLLDTTCRQRMLEGGNRGGKTSHSANMAAYDWLLYGGPGAEFALLAPEMKQAHLIKKKLFEGETTNRFNPPIIPDALWLAIPEKERQEDQCCHMVDGSNFWITHAKQAGHLKGRAWVRAYWTEAYECMHSEVHTVARARLVDAAGILTLDSTPGRDLKHWLKTGVVDVANAEKHLAMHAKPTDPPVPRLTRILNFSSMRNPWICPDEMALARADAAKRDPQAARREFDGEWCSDFATLFGDVWDGSFHVRDIPAGGLAAIGLTDITKAASRKFFKGTGHDWIVGCDVNHAPTAFNMCKIFGDIDDESTWGIAVLDEHWVWNEGPTGAGKQLARIKDRRYAGAGISIDATAAHKNSRAGHKNGRTGTPALEFRSLGFNCRPCNTSSRTGKHSNPDVQDSTNLVKWLLRARPHRLIVNSTCVRTIRAIESQEDRGDGRPPKVSNSYTDREINNVVECLRYISWPLFTSQFHRGDRKKIKL